jgi:hypothetical protein
VLRAQRQLLHCECRGLSRSVFVFVRQIGSEIPLRRSFAFLLAILAAGTAITAVAEEGERPTGLNALPEVEFSALSQPDRNPLALHALAIHPQEWRHGETGHFIYHFVHSYVATPISIEAEFQFRVITRELEAQNSPLSGEKSHIYIFEKPEDWKAFQANARLEPWTGGIHSRGSLFIMRDPAYKFSDNSLGHEIAHLVLFRLYQRELPRWLDEGFAEYVSRITRASYQRARNYVARPHSRSIAAGQLIPLAQLTTMEDYPANEQLGFFYDESERLVRFLTAADPVAFRALLAEIGSGGRFDIALSRHYASRFSDVATLEKQFFSYASQDAENSASAE